MVGLEVELEVGVEAGLKIGLEVGLEIGLEVRLSVGLYILTRFRIKAVSMDFNKQSEEVEITVSSSWSSHSELGPKSTFFRRAILNLFLEQKLQFLKPMSMESFWIFFVLGPLYKRE